MRETAFTFQLMVVPFEQQRNRVRGEELGRHTFLRGFPRHRFGTVLAELEGRAVFLSSHAHPGQSKPSG
jgi:hypothetical protein